MGDDSDELVVLGVARNCKMMSFGVGKLVWTRATSFMCPVVLGGRGFGVVLVEMDDFPIFSCFWAKLAILDRVSMAAVVVDGAIASVEVTDGVGAKKMVIFGEISLVEPIFGFFLPFPLGSV